ncbi:MAG: PD40 domain-containing protein [Anaerolineales bacterium]|nr:MAG: PD40 domain-containing protein [Anaerolineales bacterium]
MLSDPVTPSLRRTLGYWLRLIAAGVLLGIVLLYILANGSLGSAGTPQAVTSTPTTALLAAQEPTALPTHTVMPTPQATPLVMGAGRSLDGLRVLSLSEYGYARLFSHQLIGQSLTRLTYGQWDDVSPAFSSQSGLLAFASNRNGNWDLYVLELATGITSQLTHDSAYDGSPSWSDNGWLAYTHDHNNDLEIAIRPLDGSVEPLYVSLSPARDHSPAWRPHAQQLAFVSDRGGAPAIWLLYLEQEGATRFAQLAPERGVQASPAWSPDGRWLAWAEQDPAGMWNIYVSDMLNPPRYIGSGQAPQWSPAGDVLLAKTHTETEHYLTAYTLDGELALAPQALPGRVHGAAWTAGEWPSPPAGLLQAAAAAQPEAAWAQLAESYQVVPLSNVFSPNPSLSSAAAAPFEALRQRTAQLLGWDALSSLENSLVPLSTPLPPGQYDSWLLTGRAFALRSGLLNAGWLAAVREDIGGQTYWRIYLRTAAPDSGMGQPLTQNPWDFAARYSGVESSYQAGGQLADEVPAGYWIDFTALAADYGFERLPAQANWRSFFPSTLFNQFVLRDGLSWQDAMLQLYSAEVISAPRP